MDNDVKNRYGVPTLISNFRNNYNKKIATLLKEAGIDDVESSYGGIIFYLLKHEMLTMQQLAKHINRDKSTVTVLVRKLEQKGYVNTKSCENDKRVKYIMLTEKARGLERTFKEISKKVNELIWEGVSEEVAEQFITVLLKISQNIKGEQ